MNKLFNNMEWFEESLYNNENIGYKQSLLKKKTLIKKTSLFQEIEIFETPYFGKVLTLDGVIQTTTLDEFFYHEMFVHVPLFSHKSPKKVLIIGGGDGGILREVLKHSLVEEVTMIEIDADVVNLCTEYLPELSNGAFNNLKAKVMIVDGINFVKTTNNKFDIIIVDSTDPIGSAEVLFTDDFFINAKKCLNDSGILCTQSGVPFLQPQELVSNNKRFKKLFQFSTFFLVPVPTYIGGFMAISFNTNNVNVEQRTDFTNIKHAYNIDNLKYYNTSIHTASFVLPAYILRLLSE